jgi:hypothetical protein
MSVTVGPSKGQRYEGVVTVGTRPKRVEPSGQLAEHCVETLRLHKPLRLWCVSEDTP